MNATLSLVPDILLHFLQAVLADTGNKNNCFKLFTIFYIL